MTQEYEKYTVRQLREMVWLKGLLPKRWMLNYVKKAEAISMLVSFQHPHEIPVQYLETIKKRNSEHRKKVYRSRKSRQEKFGAALTREERLKFVINAADTLLFKEHHEIEDGFTSFLGSTRAKHAFIFVDSSDNKYMFTKAEVQKLSSMGLYIPHGILSVPSTAKSSNKKTLRDIFSDSK